MSTPTERPLLVDLLNDLDAERSVLQGRLVRLDPRARAAPTPCPGWDVDDQVDHLVVSDRLSLVALTDPTRFARLRAAAEADPVGFERRGLADARADPDRGPAGWRALAGRLRRAFVGFPAGERVGWFGSSMSPLSLATARLMETWAHGWDVAVAIGVDPVPTDRLRHVADLGVRARGHGYRVRGRPAPTTPVRVELRLPSGAGWTAGPADANDAITGTAEEFCLVLARRLAWTDTALTARGDAAAEWLRIGQMYAGSPGTPGPDPRTPSGRNVS